jgi:hypothetical protein
VRVSVAGAVSITEENLRNLQLSRKEIDEG